MGYGGPDWYAEYMVREQATEAAYLLPIQMDAHLQHNTQYKKLSGSET